MGPDARRWCHGLSADVLSPAAFRWLTSVQRKKGETSNSADPAARARGALAPGVGDGSGVAEGEDGRADITKPHANAQSIGALIVFP